jgi:hypothetical protein
MALLNVNLQFLPYLDATKTSNPMMKLADLKFSFQGVPTDLAKQIPFRLAPGETQSIVNNTRTLSFNGSTAFAIQLVAGTDRARLSGSFGARTARTYGDATTQWAVTMNNGVCRLTYTATGTAPTFGTMQAGDGCTIESGSAFNPLNWGDFVLTGVGSNYIEFFHPTGTAETVAAKVAVYSSGPVQAGDVLDLQDVGFTQVNRGQFPITRVTDSYVEFSNPNAVAQSGVTGVTLLSIYTALYNWLLCATDQRVCVRFNGDSGSTNEVEPPVPGDLNQNAGLLMKRGRTYRIDINNLSAVPATGFVCMVP